MGGRRVLRTPMFLMFLKLCRNHLKLKLNQRFECLSTLRKHNVLCRMPSCVTVGQN